MIKKIIALLAVASSLGCDSDSDEAFDVTALKASIVEMHETPAHTDLVQQTTLLNQNIETFYSEPTATNLVNAQEAWLSCAVAYSKTEIFNIGDVQSSYIHYGLYGWGALTNNIETTISENSSWESFDVNSLPTNSRGLSAIEYLLFGQSEGETLLAFENENRLKFLSLLGDNLSEKVSTLDNLWTLQRTAFVENPEDGLDGGINQLINAINNTLSLVKKLKIGIPAGLESSGIDMDALQAEISGNSLALIEANLKIIEDVYFSGETNLSQYVESIAGNTEINDAFSASFGNIGGLISQIDQPLSIAITDQTDQVEALHEEVTVLIRLFTADVSSILSLTITPTDADGD